MDEFDEIRQARLKTTRAILRNAKFLAMGPNEQQAFLDKLLAKGLSENDLRMLLAEQHNQAIDPFRTLDKGVLVQILVALNPVDVISTCATDKRYSRICSEPSTFRQLLIAHYPLAFATDNPRQQYIALTTGIETNYRMDRIDHDFEKFEFENPVQIGKSSLPENTPGWSIANIPYGYVHDLFRINISSIFSPWLQRTVNPQDYAKATSDWAQYLLSIGTQFQDDKQKETVARLAEELTPIMKNFIAWDRKNALISGSKYVSQDFIDEGKSQEYHQDHDNNIVFSIKGNSLPKGTQAWALIWQSHTGLMEDHVDVYKTREDMAREFVNNNYIHLVDALVRGSFPDYIYETQGDDAMGELDIEAMPEEEVMKLKLFDDFLLQYNVVVRPFTREGLYEYAMIHDEFHLFPGSERDWWLFRPITF